MATPPDPTFPDVPPEVVATMSPKMREIFQAGTLAPLGSATNFFLHAENYTFLRQCELYQHFIGAGGTMTPGKQFILDYATDCPMQTQFLTLPALRVGNESRPRSEHVGAAVASLLHNMLHAPLPDQDIREALYHRHVTERAAYYRDRWVRLGYGNYDFASVDKARTAAVMEVVMLHHVTRLFAS